MRASGRTDFACASARHRVTVANRRRRVRPLAAERLVAGTTGSEDADGWTVVVIDGLGADAGDGAPGDSNVAVPFALVPTALHPSTTWLSIWTAH